MSKYIKINQSKDNVTERKDLIDTLETNLETEQEKMRLEKAPM